MQSKKNKCHKAVQVAVRFYFKKLHKTVSIQIKSEAYLELKNRKHAQPDHQSNVPLGKQLDPNNPIKGKVKREIQR
jgi:acetyl-CoA carboxylase beta subunit